jgi:hypothetical protein
VREYVVAVELEQRDQVEPRGDGVEHQHARGRVLSSALDISAATVDPAADELQSRPIRTESGDLHVDDAEWQK